MSANRIDAVTFGELAAEVRLLGGGENTPLYLGGEHLELPKLREGRIFFPARALEEKIEELEEELENTKDELDLVRA